MALLFIRGKEGRRLSRAILMRRPNVILGRARMLIRLCDALSITASSYHSRDSGSRAGPLLLRVSRQEGQKHTLQGHIQD